MRYAYANKLQDTIELKTKSDWLENLLMHERLSEAYVREIRRYGAGEPVVLLHVREKQIRDGEQGAVVEKTTGKANSLVLWISAK